VFFFFKSKHSVTGPDIQSKEYGPPEAGMQALKEGWTPFYW
jgi:hypothetical protein